MPELLDIGGVMSYSGKHVDEYPKLDFGYNLADQHCHSEPISNAIHPKQNSVDIGNLQ